MRELYNPDISRGTDVREGIHSILNGPVPPGYPAIKPGPGGRLYLDVSAQRDYESHERHFDAAGRLVNITRIELPPGHDTRSEQRQSFLDATDPEDLLAPPIDDIETGSDQVVSDEEFARYLRKYDTFDQNRRPLVWGRGDLSLLLSLAKTSLASPYIEQPIGMPVGNGTFIRPGDHPASDVYAIMPLKGAELKDHAVLLYATPDGRLAPPGGFGSARDKIDGKYRPYAAARRHCLMKTGFDIEEFPLKVVSMRPKLNEYTTLNSRLIVTNNLVKVFYSRDIAREVLTEIPEDEELSGAYWVSVKALTRTANHPRFWESHRQALLESFELLEGREMPDYDIFLSVAGPDRLPATKLARELGKHGLTVFYDEDISEGQGITERITTALSRSTAFVAYYSKEYLNRWACQWELRYIYRTLFSGELNSRIIVVNPDDPQTEHILPQELTDAKYHTATNLTKTAAEINDRMSRLSGWMPMPRLSEMVWFGHAPMRPSFVGRFRELWLLHGLLTRNRFPLTAEVLDKNAMVAITGKRGIGKTALAAAYGLQFGNSSWSNMYWIDLEGCKDSSSEEVLSTYANKLYDLARLADISVEEPELHHLLGRIGAYTRSLSRPSLWVVDGLPDGVDPAIIHKLAIPTDQVGMIFVTPDSERDMQLALPTLRLEELTTQEAQILLDAYRKPKTSQEVAARDQIIALLGTHPGMLIEHIAKKLVKYPERTYQTQLEQLEKDEPINRKE